MNDEWVKVRKGSSAQAHEIRPLISFRRTSFGFNSYFVKHADLTKFRFVTIYVQPAHYKLGFKFHNDKTDQDAYTQLKSHSIQVGRLFTKFAWLRAVSQLEDERARRFEPLKNPDGLWEIQVCPAFETVVSDKSKIPSSTTGIYRYRRGKEVVYIGRGNIKDRTLAQERRDWEFDKIEYSITEDEPEQRKWETYWLDQFFKDHARLPLYNRIKGAQDKSQKS